MAKILVAVSLLSALLLGAKNAAAFFDGGNDDSPGGGWGCNDYNSGANWCSRFRAWYYYEYDENIDYGAIKVEAYSGLNFGSFSRVTEISVSDQCDNNSSGFYVSGLILWDDLKRTGSGTLENDDVSANDVFAFKDPKRPSTYNGHWIGVKKYDTSAPNTYLTETYKISYKPSDGSNSMKSVITVAPSVVEEAWNDYGKDYAKKSNPENSENLSDYSWFCAGDKAKKQEQYYKGDAFVRISENSSANLSMANSDDLTTCANGDCDITISGGGGTKNIYFMAAGKVLKDEKQSISEGYEEFEGTSFTLYNAKSVDGTAIANTSVDKTGTINDISRHINFDADNAKNAGYIQIDPGEEKKICAVNSYKTHYKDGKYDDNTDKAHACVTIKYRPEVAEIDSKTTLYLGPTAIESGIDQAKVYSISDVDYKANAISAVWSYSLSSSKRCFEGDFKNGVCSENKTSITSSFKVPFNRVGDVVNNSGDSTLSSPGYSAAPEASSKSYNLLPGEQLTQKQGISHKSGVRTDGTAANGAIDESSSVELTATAKDATCSLNNKPFGLTNPINYGRLTITAKSRSFVYGDTLDDGNPTWADAGTVWLKPDDSVQLSYEACIGEQIKRDKNSGKGWEDAFTDNNAVLTVGTSGNALDGSHYTGVTDAVDVSSDSGKSVVAYEKIGNTITGHVSNDYQFVGSKAAKSNSAFVGHLGQTITNDFGNLNKDIHAAMKIPYNYNLDPSISPLGNTVTTIGGETKFEVSIKREERTNQQVDATNTYKTDIKPNTKAKYVSFRLPSDFNYSTLSAWQDSHETTDGDITDSLADFIQANLSGSIGIIGGGEISSTDINSDKVTTVTVGAGSADTDFNKLCVIAGVYPADSHNVRAKDINNENQDNALTDGAGSGAFTRISVSCKTVGKYPTTSVEGNGIVAGGSVNGAYTAYSGRNYGSWAEYGLVANSVQNFASGASAAYTNAQTTINASAASDLSGIKTTYFDSPQTLGNMSMNVGLQDAAEASLYVSQMQSYVEDVKSTFFNGASGGSEIIKKFNNKTYVNTNFNGDVEISQSLANDINAKANDGLVIIYSTKDIRISNEVQTLNAVLLADGKVDTCSEADQGGDNGQLLEKCYNPLVVNGVVFSNESIALDRAYGGGSTTGMDLNADALIQRAEIFNFDPEVVSWGYNYKFETQPITTTYIEELSTRY